MHRLIRKSNRLAISPSLHLWLHFDCSYSNRVFDLENPLLLHLVDPNTRIWTHTHTVYDNISLYLQTTELRQSPPTPCPAANNAKHESSTIFIWKFPFSWPFQSTLVVQQPVWGSEVPSIACLWNKAHSHGRLHMMHVLFPPTFLWDPLTLTHSHR